MATGLFALVDPAWARTVHSHDKDVITGAKRSRSRLGGACTDLRCECHRLDCTFMAIVIVLTMLFALAPLRYEHSSYMSLPKGATVAAREWLTAEIDRRFAANASAALPSLAPVFNGSSLVELDPLESTLSRLAYATVVIEVGAFAAALAGICAIGLALMHGFLAWNSLAPDARGRIRIVAFIAIVVTLRTLFLNSYSRAIVFWPFKRTGCIVTTTNTNQAYLVSVLTYVYLSLGLVYKGMQHSLSGHGADRESVPAGSTVAGSGSVSPPSLAAGSSVPRPSALSHGSGHRTDARAAMVASGSAAGSTAQLAGSTVDEDGGSNAGVPFFDAEADLGPAGDGEDEMSAGDDDGMSTPRDGPEPGWDAEEDEAKAPALEPRHFYLLPLGSFLVLTELVVQPSVTQDWAVTLAQAMGYVAVAAVAVSTCVAWLSIRLELRGPVAPVMCGSLGFMGFPCCCLCPQPRHGAAPGPGGPAGARGAAGRPAAPAPAACSCSRVCCCCCRRVSPRCVVNCMHIVVFPAAILLPGAVPMAFNPECPQWLQAGADDGSASFPDPPAGLHWPIGLDPAERDHRDAVILSLVRVMVETGAAALVSVFLSGAVILDGQAELAARRRDAAAESADTLRRAIGYISHEARGPLNAAVLSLALLEDVGGSDEEDEDDAGGAAGEDELTSERLLGDLATSISASKRHLDDLLLWERAGADGDKDAHARWVWAEPQEGWMRHVSRAFRSTCEAEGIGLDVRAVRVLDRRAAAGEARPDEWRGTQVFIDADRVLGVCTNAVSNCIKHTPGGGRGRIAAVCTVLVGRAAAAVGLGPPAQQPAGMDAAATSALPCSAALPRRRAAASVRPAEPRAARPGRPTGSSSGSPRSAATASFAGAQPRSRGPQSSALGGAGDWLPPERGVLQVEVLDNGRGISRALLESGKLFQPFARLRQGDDSLRMASSGLGLAIVRSIIVDGMRGRVGLASEEGVGTAFFARVPVWVRRPAREQGSAAPSDASPAHARGSRILDRTDAPGSEGPVAAGTAVSPAAGPRGGAGSAASPPMVGAVSSRSSPLDAGEAGRRVRRASRRSIEALADAAGASSPSRDLVRYANSRRELDEARRLAAEATAAASGASAQSRGDSPPPQGLEGAGSFGRGGGREEVTVSAGASASRGRRGLDQAGGGGGGDGGGDGGDATGGGPAMEVTGAAATSGRGGRQAPGSSAGGLSARSTGSSRDRAARAARREKRKAERGAAGGRQAGGGKASGPRGRDGRSVVGRAAFVVDDERVNRTLLAALLRRWGLVVREFDNGGEVVAALKAAADSGSGIPSIMTLDVEMPVLNGFGVLKKRQQLARDAAKKGNDALAQELLKMPVIVVSGNARHADREKLMELGAKAVLAKPVDPDQLASLISRYSSRA